MPETWNVTCDILPWFKVTGHEKVRCLIILGKAKNNTFHSQNNTPIKTNKKNTRYANKYLELNTENIKKHKCIKNKITKNKYLPVNLL